MNRTLLPIILILSLTAAFSDSLCAEQAKGPKVIIDEGPPPDYSTTGEILVEYSNPEWMTDEEILALKVTSEYKHDHSWLAQMSKGTRTLKRREYQIISFDLNTREEKVIFAGVPMLDFSYNHYRNILAITTGLNVDYEESPFGRKQITIVDLVTNRTTQIPVDGYNVRLSPKGDMLLLYNFERKVAFVYSLEENKEIFSTPKYVRTWDPNTETIIAKLGKEMNYEVIRIDPRTGSETKFEPPGFPDDWARDGSCYYNGWILCLNGEKIKLPVRKIGGDHRLSPNKERLLGIGGIEEDGWHVSSIEIYSIQHDSRTMILKGKRTLKRRKLIPNVGSLL